MQSEELNNLIEQIDKYKEFLSARLNKPKRKNNNDTNNSYFIKVSERYDMIKLLEKSSDGEVMSPYGKISIPTKEVLNEYKYVNSKFFFHGSIYDIKKIKKDNYIIRAFSFDNIHFIPGTAELYKALFISVILDDICNEYDVGFSSMPRLYDFFVDNNCEFVLTKIWDELSPIVYDKTFFGSTALLYSTSFNTSKSINDIIIKTNESTKFLKKYFHCPEGKNNETLDKLFTILSNHKPLKTLLSSVTFPIKMDNKCYRMRSILNTGFFKITNKLTMLDFSEFKYSNKSIEDDLLYGTEKNESEKLDELLQFVKDSDTDDYENEGKKETD